MEKLKPYKACMKDKKLLRGTGQLKQRRIEANRAFRRFDKEQLRRGNVEVSPISVGYWD